MRGASYLMLMLTLLVVVAVVDLEPAVAQEAGGEGAIRGPQPVAARGDIVDPETLKPVLYFIAVGLVVVAVIAIIQLAMGRGEMKGRRALTEGERRMGRMIKEGDTDFRAGRQAEELPDHMKS